MKRFKTAIVVGVLVCLVVGYYFYLDNRQGIENRETEAPTTEVSNLITRDISTNYPSTPREVVKLYSRIITCYYDEDTTDTEIDQLAMQARYIFDDELLENNPEATYLENVHADVEEFAENSMIISSYVIEKASAVDYHVSEAGQEYATVNTMYSLRQKSAFSKSYIDYLLRKDENGNWKILLWDVVEATEIETE